MKTSRVSLAVIAGAAVFLCAVIPSSGGANPDPMPSIRQDSGTHATAGNGLTSSIPIAEVQEPFGDLTLRQAIELAFAGNPDLASFSWEVRSGDVRILQAGLIPNPEIGVNVENILGTGPFRNFDSSETTLSISQLVELGGKRAARIRLASAGKEIVGWDYEAKRADLAAEVSKSFVGILSAQEKLTLAEETTRLLDIRASIKTHTEGFYPLESRDFLHGKKGYPFVLNIDGQAVVWKVDGREETIPIHFEKGGRNPEGGTGVRYDIQKRIRLAAGSHRVFFGLPAEDYYREFDVMLKSGKSYTLGFEPVYKKQRRDTRKFLSGLDWIEKNMTETCP